MNRQSIAGIHHITAIASDPQRNLDFYTQVLGLRLVKRTVNFDDPGTYHFYFGDEAGTPGTILTFFPWGNIRPGRRGRGQVSTVSFLVPPGSHEFWREHLDQAGVSAAPPFQRMGETVMTLLDPDGMPIELTARPGEAGLPGMPWEAGPIPTHWAIRGFAAPTLLLGEAGPTADLLTFLGFQPEAQEGPRQRFTSAGGPGLGAWIDLEVRPMEPAARSGAGVVHHIALRAADGEEQLAWREALVRQGYEVTPVMDRQYFQSIYFREPGGVLFEIATDTPGFAIDEAPHALGTALKLPPWYESRRDMIEGSLPPLQIPVSGR